MEKSKFENREQLAVHGLEQFQKMALGFIPGGHVIDGFLNYRSSLKQQRVLNFAESLKVVFEKEIGKDIDDYNFENEDFVDVIDSVMTQVQNGKSQFKLDRFRDIVVNSVKSKNDLVQTYIDITSALNEVQIKALYSYYESEMERKKVLEALEINCKEYIDLTSKEKEFKAKASNGKLTQNDSIKAIMGEVNDNQISRRDLKEQYLTKTQMIQIEFGISQSEYEYYSRDLISKSLLKEHDIDVFGDGNSIPFIEVTEFAKGYLAFIELRG